jgi:hypothetical protein
MFEVLSQSVAATADRKSLGNLLWISTVMREGTKSYSQSLQNDRLLKVETKRLCCSTLHAAVILNQSTAILCLELLGLFGRDGWLCPPDDR